MSQRQEPCAESRGRSRRWRRRPAGFSVKSLCPSARARRSRRRRARRTPRSSGSRTSWQRRTQNWSGSGDAWRSRRRNRTSSPNPEQLERSGVPIAQYTSHARVLGPLEARIAIEQKIGRDPRALVERLVAHWIGNAEGRHTALPLAEQIAHSAKLEIRARDRKPVLRAGDHTEAAGHFGAHVAKQNAIRRFCATTHTAAQLMQLRQTKPLRV